MNVALTCGRDLRRLLGQSVFRRRTLARLTAGPNFSNETPESGSGRPLVVAAYNEYFRLILW